MLAYIGAILVMILGFGFVIFWHELGHFLGARWAKMRVEQFAVGMGHAVVSFRKGIGLKLGSTHEEFERRTRGEFMRQQQERLGPSTSIEPTLREQYDVAKSLGIGETEYRLAWIPIGGYVKPTGQDDLRPRSLAAKDDPGSYAAAPVGKRMVMISAGVIMNVILAAILFFVLFRFIGFNSPPPVISYVQSGSPAAMVGLQGGDELVSLNGHTLHDFTKVTMWAALMPSDEPVELKIRRDGQEITKSIQLRVSQDNVNMLAMGVSPPLLLRALPGDKVVGENLDQLSDDAKAVLPDERIVAVNGQAVTDQDYAIFARALETSFGKPVEITIQNAAGERRSEPIQPVIAPGFNRQTVRFAGLGARTLIGGIETKSSASGKLKEGDIVLSMRGKSADSIVNHPSPELFRIIVSDAGRNETPLTLTVLRGEQILELEPITPGYELPDGKVGLGVGLNADFAHAVVASETVATTRSVPQLAVIPAGSIITAIEGNPVASWYDVHRVLSGYTKPSELFVSTFSAAGEQTYKIALSEQDIQSLAGIRYTSPLALLDGWTRERKTESALTAVQWGVEETRDLILQTYVTLRRVVGGSVPASNLSGPIGIFRVGTQFAQKGPDWFIWFLALVSANLAVVNFLPIPILDGWHFLSLLKEKVTGTPVNERVQEYASWLGLALILSLLIFVTFNDLTR